MSRLDSVAGNLLALMPFIRNKLFWPPDPSLRARLSPLQFVTLSLLHKQGGQKMSELAAVMRISKQQLTPLMAKLIDQGYAMRQADPGDRRSIRIELTEAGRSLLAEVRHESKVALSARLQKLDEREVAELEQILERLREILSQI